MTMWMDPDELSRFTGFRQKKKQIAFLREQGIPFHINGRGQPVVAKVVGEGQKPRPAAPKQAPAPWSPAVLQRA